MSAPASTPRAPRAPRARSLLHTRTGWIVFACAAVVVLVVVPLLNRLAPESSFLYVPDFAVPLLGKFLCYAIVALALDVVWGYAGILSLGHGVFFTLGGYCMGMHLMRVSAGEGVYRSELPDFMVFLDWKELPWYWRGFQSLPFALAMALFVPGVVAFVFGYFAFRSRIKGVYLSIITQALTFAFSLLFFRNATGFGGNNGLTDFKRLAGFSLQDPSTKLGLYVASGLALVASYLVCRFVVAGRIGRVLTAIRDAEPKARFSGYDTVRYKLFAWTMSAVLCGVAGALYTPQVGIINPSEMAPSSSIEMVLWVAVGGRGTLVGAIVGAVAISGVKSWLTASLPSAWLYCLGALFIVVTLVLPRGLAGLPDLARDARARFLLRRRVTAPAPTDATPSAGNVAPNASERRA